jgi:hypothetical protein
MTYSSGTIGGTSGSPTSTYGNGVDYTSGFSISTNDANKTGGVSGNSELSDYPIYITNFTMYFRSSVANNVEIELDNTKEPAGSNRASYKVTNSDTSPSFNPQWQGYAGDTLYGGFRKLNTNTVNWYRQAAKSNLVNPGYDIYRDGSTDTAFSGTSQYMGVSWNTVPSAPASYSVGTITGTSVTLSWTAPSVNGLGGNGSTGITGYRVLYRQWSAGNTYSWAPFLTGVGTALIGTGSTLTCTITGLTPNTPYEFKIAATNSVSDSWGTTYASIGDVVGSNLTTSAIYTLSGPKVYSENWNTRSTIKVYNGATWTTGVMRVWDEVSSRWVDLT